MYLIEKAIDGFNSSEISFRTDLTQFLESL